jgi:hypothetical protein
MAQASAKRIRTIGLLSVIGAVRILIGILPAAAQAPATLSEAQEVNGAPGVVAEVVQCIREAGVLSIRMRLRNTGDNEANVRLINGRNYDQYYVTAGSKKYFVLRDSEKTPLATPSDGFGNASAGIPKGGSYVFYAKYPAPPAEVKKVSYYTPITPPFEDVPISE